MRTDTPKTIYLKDYQPYPFDIERVSLCFDIRDGETIVTAQSSFKAKGDDLTVFLNGEAIELLSFKIDGVDYSAYDISESSISFVAPSPVFNLEIITKIIPEDNTRLEGLYMSGGNYCTQCEAEGFRRITYWPDRPDVLSVYTVRVEADKKFPVLLSNGNRIDAGDAGPGRHYSTWLDPWPKPSYLFALVAGDLELVHDTYITGSGRKVDLNIFVRKGDESQCSHAMKALKDSMRWDEEVYGLEYDLDLFNIVAVSDFNMGAMENKSLNIFNTALVLAHQQTATDNDFLRVESVIAHEYFHNWSGNRVTCRDWFQLSLKEGLTVFRDQEFSADMNSRSVQRIDDVTHLRQLQFAEDSGPLAHPIRPDNYIEINNFYTMTVYEKGAEVIRMLYTIVGAKNYRKGTDLYFSRHDGQAVTCEDWIKCHEEASGIDLSQFRLWYSQAGTPEVDFKGVFDGNSATYTVKLSQRTPATPGQPDKKPMLIPVALGLLGENGEDLIGTDILLLKDAEQEFKFPNIKQKPVPSILRNFSAPVKLTTDLSDEDYSFLTEKEVYDGFNRWEAGQYLHRKMLNMLTDQIESGRSAVVPEMFLQGYGRILEDALAAGDSDKALFAKAMTLPDVGLIAQGRTNANPAAVYKARQSLLASLKRTHKVQLDKIYNTNRGDKDFSITPEAMGRRALCNTALALLTSTYGTGCAKRSKEHYIDATNMTDRMAALACLASNSNPERDEVFADFYDRFKNYPLVIDKWFSVQASYMRNDLINHLKKLRQHTDFNIKNPNRVRSLYSAFAMNNLAGFHAEDGSGYEFLSNAIIELNDINPQIAARLLTPLRSWRQYSSDRQVKMKAALERVLETPRIAPDVYEIASKSLNG